MKIIVRCDEFETEFGKLKVDCSFYHGTGGPVIATNKKGEREHLGQWFFERPASENFEAAKNEMNYENWKEHFDELFPEENGNFEFEYKFRPYKDISSERLLRSITGLLEEAKDALNRKDVTIRRYKHRINQLEDQITAMGGTSLN